MTAYPDCESLSEAKRIGADYIEKGTRGEYLIDKIITNYQTSKKGQLLSIEDNIH